MIQTQIDFARQARDKGIQRSIDHANQVHDSWSDRAFELFRNFIYKRKTEFMCEDFRDTVADLLPSPPSKRAFGGVFMKAARLGLIRRVRYDKVKNIRAHQANASVWRAT